MKDGEVSVLGGLSLVNDQNSVSGIPGITNIPILGYLFGTRSKFHENDDIMIALIPHIVRAPDLTVIGEDGVVAGTERVIKVRRRPAEGSPAGSTPNSPASPNPLPPAAAPPSTPTPNPPSQTPPSGNPAALPPPPPRVPPHTAPGQPRP
jgi:general secretion pathway protein D